jgi:hypothetical protein
LLVLTGRRRRHAQAADPAVTTAEYKLFQQALKHTHSDRWSHKGQFKTSSNEPAYTDM